jgi:hypothetical protein
VRLQSDDSRQTRPPLGYQGGQGQEAGVWKARGYATKRVTKGHQGPGPSWLKVAKAKAYTHQEARDHHQGVRPRLGCQRLPQRRLQRKQR